MQEVSACRMQLLLVLNSNKTKIVIALLSRMTALMKELLAVRHKVWYKQASDAELWDIQRDFVKTGYQLLMEIKGSLMSVQNEELLLSEESKEEFSEDLSIPFEQANISSLAYGLKQDFSLILIWEIQNNAEWLKFVEKMSHDSQERFEENFKEFSHELYECNDVLEVNPIMLTVDQGSLKVFCLSGKFLSKKILKLFIESQLPQFRKKYKTLWSSFRSPIEYYIGIQ
jgi:hypothetical protein